MHQAAAQREYHELARVVSDVDHQTACARRPFNVSGHILDPDTRQLDVGDFGRQHLECFSRAVVGKPVHREPQSLHRQFHPFPFALDCQPLRAPAGPRCKALPMPFNMDARFEAQ